MYAAVLLECITKLKDACGQLQLTEDLQTLVAFLRESGAPKESPSFKTCFPMIIDSKEKIQQLLERVDKTLQSDWTTLEESCLPVKLERNKAAFMKELKSYLTWHMNLVKMPVDKVNIESFREAI